MDTQTFQATFQRLGRAANRFTSLESEDLAQETLIQMWTAQVPQPWSPAILNRTLRWRAIDRHRKVRNLPTVPLLDRPQRPQAEQAILVRQLLAREPHARIVEMSVIDGLSPHEIAAELGISANAVAVRKHRALERLRRAASEAA